MNDREYTTYALAKRGGSTWLVGVALRALPAIQRGHEAACIAWPEDMVEAFTKRGDAAFDRLRAAMVEEKIAGHSRIRHQNDPRGCTVEVYAEGVDMESAEPILRLGAPGFTAAELKRLDRAAEYRMQHTK